MRVTKEIIEKILDKRETTGLSYGEIGRRINMTSQNVGRFMSGQVKSINDSSGELLLQFLGIKEPPPNRMGHLFEIVVDTKAMEPVIGKGQVILGRTVHPNDVESGAIVVLSFADVDGEDHTLCRYFAKRRKSVTLTAEDGSATTTTVSRINWIAQVFQPTRKLTAG